MNRVTWRTLLLLMGIVALVAGCSDDDSIVDPVEEPDPLSRLFQVNVNSSGVAYAVGVEGRIGKIYTNESGAWALFENQGPTVGTNPPTGVLPVSASEVYLYAATNPYVYHYMDDFWFSQDLPITPNGGARLVGTAGGMYLLETDDSTVLRNRSGTWERFGGIDVPETRPVALAEAQNGTVIVSFALTEYDSVLVSRYSGDSVVVDAVSGRLDALAAAGGDTVWAAGTRLARFADSTWEFLATIPDTNTVIEIGQPMDGSLTLVCASGMIYRWQDDAFETVLATKLVAPLTSVCYVDETTIYGTVNYVEPNTGHETGIIVRFNGTQWITEFLAPPTLP